MNGVTEKISTVTAMVAKTLQEMFYIYAIQSFILITLYIHVICFIIYLLYICMYVIYFFNFAIYFFFHII